MVGAAATSPPTAGGGTCLDGGALKGLNTEFMPPRPGKRSLTAQAFNPHRHFNYVWVRDHKNGP